MVSLQELVISFVTDLDSSPMIFNETLCLKDIKKNWCKAVLNNRTFVVRMSIFKQNVFQSQNLQLANDKMALKVMEKDIAETEDIPIVVVTSTDIVSNIKGYHVYKSVWTPTL